MAYFPNGTSGMKFEEQFCCRCVHMPVHNVNPPKDCPILVLHAMWNYDQIGTAEEHKTKSQILEMLIPSIEINGVKYPGKCSMFFEAPKEDPSTQLNISGE